MVVAAACTGVAALNFGGERGDDAAVLVAEAVVDVVDDLLGGVFGSDNISSASSLVGVPVCSPLPLSSGCHVGNASVSVYSTLTLIAGLVIMLGCWAAVSASSGSGPAGTGLGTGTWTGKGLLLTGTGKCPWSAVAGLVAGIAMSLVAIGVVMLLFSAAAGPLSCWSSPPFALSLAARPLKKANMAPSNVFFGRPVDALFRGSVA